MTLPSQLACEIASTSCSPFNGQQVSQSVSFSGG